MNEVRIYTPQGHLKEIIPPEKLIAEGEKRRKKKEPGTNVVINKRADYPLRKDGTQ